MNKMENISIRKAKLSSFGSLISQKIMWMDNIKNDIETSLDLEQNKSKI